MSGVKARSNKSGFGDLVNVARDLNEDGVADTITFSPGQGNVGQLSIFMGISPEAAASMGTILPETMQPPIGLTITIPVNPRDWLFAALTSGDIDGDGQWDVIYSLPTASPDGIPCAGEVQAIKGGDYLNGLTSPAPISALKRLIIKGIFLLEGYIVWPERVARNQCDYCGSGIGTRLVTGDFNGDKKADIVITASCFSPVSYGPRAFGRFGNENIFNEVTRLDALNEGDGFRIVDAEYGTRIEALAASDTNGDGIDELIMLVTFVSTRVFVLQGQPDGYPLSIILSRIGKPNGQPGFVLDGDAGAYSTEYSIATGYINNDRFADIVILGDVGNDGISFNPKLRLWFGNKTTPTIVKEETLKTVTDVSYVGSSSLVVYDVNGDSWADVMTPGYGGSVSMLSGRALTEMSYQSIAIDMLARQPNGASLTGINSDNTGYGFGAVSLGAAANANGDGVVTIAIGLPNDGLCYRMFSCTGQTLRQPLAPVAPQASRPKALPSQPVVQAFTAPVMIPAAATLTKINALDQNLPTSPAASSTIGIGVTSGEIVSVTTLEDIDGDGVNDVAVVIAPSLTEAKMCILYMPKCAFNSVLLDRLDKKSGFCTGVFSIVPGYPLTISSAGDLNGNGRSDVIVGASGEANGCGAVLVIDGETISSSTEGAKYTEDKTIFTFIGLNKGDLVGAAVGVMKWLTGYPSVVVGAMGALGGRGECYLVHGSSEFNPRTVDKTFLDGITGSMLAGALPGDGMGGTVEGLGDMDGDDLPDLAIAAYNAYANLGMVCLLSGRLMLERNSADIGLQECGVINGTFPNGQFGKSLAYIGPFTNNGFGSMAIGAPQSNSGSGSVCIVSGGSPVRLRCWARILSDVPDAMFGSSISPGGDMNGDRISDILVGAEGAYKTGIVIGLLGRQDFTVATTSDIEISGGFMRNGTGKKYGTSVASSALNASGVNTNWFLASTKLIDVIMGECDPAPPLPIKADPTPSLSSSGVMAIVFTVFPPIFIGLILATYRWMDYSLSGNKEDKKAMNRKAPSTSQPPRPTSPLLGRGLPPTGGGGSGVSAPLLSPRLRTAARPVLPSVTQADVAHATRPESPVLRLQPRPHRAARGGEHRRVTRLPSLDGDEELGEVAASCSDIASASSRSGARTLRAYLLSRPHSPSGRAPLSPTSQVYPADGSTDLRDFFPSPGAAAGAARPCSPLLKSALRSPTVARAAAARRARVFTPTPPMTSSHQAPDPNKHQPGIVNVFASAQGDGGVAAGIFQQYSNPHTQQGSLPGPAPSTVSHGSSYTFGSGVSVLSSSTGVAGFSHSALLPHGSSHHGLGSAPSSPHQTQAGAAPAAPPAHLLEDLAGTSPGDYTHGGTLDALPGSSNPSPDQ